MKEPRIGDEQGSSPLFSSPSRVSPNNEKWSFLPHPPPLDRKEIIDGQSPTVFLIFPFFKKNLRVLIRLGKSSSSSSLPSRKQNVQFVFCSSFSHPSRSNQTVAQRTADECTGAISDGLWAEINFFFVCCLIRMAVVRAVEPVSIRRIFQPGLWFIYASRTEKFGRGSWS